jgi:hypothetical protein
MEATINANLKVAAEALASGGYVPGEIKFTRQIVAMGAATALTLRAVEDSAIIVHALTDNSAVTLPKASTCKGMQVTVVNIAADDAAKVSLLVATGDKIIGGAGGITGGGAATVVQSGGVASHGWANTKTGSNKGDFTTVVSDGVDSWYIIGAIGIWASL